MRLRFGQRTTADLDAVWLDRYGNLHEWAGDAWYLLGRRLETEWQMPGGFKADLILIDGPALGLGTVDPSEGLGPGEGLHPDQTFTSLSLNHVSGFVRLRSRLDLFSLATLIPREVSAEQRWLIEEDLDPPDLFLAALGAFTPPWAPIRRNPRARPSALAERVGAV